MKKKKYVVFADVKKAVFIRSLLDHYGHLENLELNGDTLKGPCLICNSQSGDPFKANLTKNVWYCFVCEKGGNILDLVAQKENVSIRDGALLIQDWFKLEEKKNPQPQKETRLQRQVKADPVRREPKKSKPKAKVLNKSETARLGSNPPLKFKRLKHLNPEYEFLQQNGFSSETVSYFGAGYFTGKRGIMKGRVAIPIHNSVGELVAYAGQKPIKSWVDYKFPEKFVPEFEIYNLHLALQDETTQRRLFITEHCFDVWRLYDAGIKNAVALFGQNITPQRVKSLSELLRPECRLILLFSGKVPETELLELLSTFFVRLVATGKEIFTEKLFKELRGL